LISRKVAGVVRAYSASTGQRRFAILSIRKSRVAD
jgi:hypothetical protein